MPEFRLPTTADEWEAISESRDHIDYELSNLWRQTVAAPYNWLDLAAAARLLERERCVERLAEWFGTQGGFDDDMSAARDRAEARRILEDAK